MSKAVMPHFLKQGRGKMFAISTSLTTMSSPGLSPYGASKAALEMTHRIWAQELKDKKVDVNILLPGGASDTPFITQAMVPGAVGERAKAGSSLLPGDVIVPPAIWLCTDATNGMTGERIIAKFWPEGVPPEEAIKKCLQPRNELPGIM
jgi:3-oxoacyl-[acyl-carrier protein] reductase